MSDHVISDKEIKCLQKTQAHSFLLPSVSRTKYRMGLDGGTYITRSDILRGQSWDMATADNSRSTRGGNVASTLKRKRIDTHTSRQVPVCSYAISVIGNVLLTSKKAECNYM